MRNTERKRKKKMSKAQCEKIHAKRRAKKRYGVKLNRESYEELCNKISKGEANFVAQQTNTRSIYDVEYVDNSGDSHLMRAVYRKAKENENRGLINTFLEPWMEGLE